MVRSFCVEPILACDINNIDQKLEEELVMLQSNGWSILSITPISFQLGYYPKLYDATKFIILAECEEETDDGRSIIIHDDPKVTDYEAFKKLLLGHKYIRTNDGKYDMKDVNTEDLEKQYGYELGTNATIDWVICLLQEMEGKL